MENHGSPVGFRRERPLQVLPKFGEAGRTRHAQIQGIEAVQEILAVALRE